MWIVTDEGKVVNSAYIETMEIERRENGFVLVAQLHEVGAQAKLALHRAFSMSALDSPSRVRLATRCGRAGAGKALEQTLRALANGMTVFRLSEPPPSIGVAASDIEPDDPEPAFESLEEEGDFAELMQPMMAAQL